MMFRALVGPIVCPVRSASAKIKGSQKAKNSSTATAQAPDSQRLRYQRLRYTRGPFQHPSARETFQQNDRPVSRVHDDDVYEEPGLDQADQRSTETKRRRESSMEKHAGCFEVGGDKERSSINRILVPQGETDRCRC